MRGGMPPRLADTRENEEYKQNGRKYATEMQNTKLAAITARSEQS